MGIATASLKPPLLLLIPRRRSLNTTAAEILTLLDSADPDTEVALDRAFPTLSPSVAAAVLHRQPDHLLRFRFFLWASQWRRLRSRASAALVLRSLLSHHSSFDLYWSSVLRARSLGLYLGPQAFSVLIEGLSRKGLHDKAVESFEIMKHEFHCPPDLDTYNSLLSVLVRNRVFVLASATYHEMLKANVLPDMTTYNILFRGMCESSRIDDALRLFDEMSQRNLAPNNRTYNVLINGLWRAGRINQARRLFHSMEESGCAPDVPTYNSLLNGYFKLGKVEEGYAFLQWSKREGYVMELRGYSCLIDGLFKAKRFMEAHSWYRKMVESGIKPDVVLYSIMIRGLVSEGRIKDALDMLTEMSKSGVVPDAYCYSAVIKGLCDIGLLDEAQSLHLEISKRDSFANTCTYTILLCGMCRKGLVKEAQQIFEEMDKVGCVPSVVTFNALISGLCKAGELEPARLLFYKMEIGKKPSLFLRLSQGSNRVIDSSSLKNMVEQLTASGRILKAYRLVMQVNNSGVSPDTWTYNSLINGFCKTENINGALKLLTDMQLKGISPDSVTYATLIDGLQRAEREEDSFKVFDQMVRNGIVPESSVYLTLMTWSSRRGKFPFVFSLWLKYLHTRPERNKDAINAIDEDFRNSKIGKAIRGLLEMDFMLKDFDLGPYTIFLIGLCQVGRLNDALTIFAALEERKVVITPPSCVKLIYDLCANGRPDLAVNIFVYTLEKGFVVRKACNHLIKCLLCDRNGKGLALDLVRKVESSNVDDYLNPTTKFLLRHHLKSTT